MKDFLGLRGGPHGILPFLSPSARKICITYMPYKSSEDQTRIDLWPLNRVEQLVLLNLYLLCLYNKFEKQHPWPVQVHLRQKQKHASLNPGPKDLYYLQLCWAYFAANSKKEDFWGFRLISWDCLKVEALSLWCLPLQNKKQTNTKCVSQTSECIG